MRWLHRNWGPPLATSTFLVTSGVLDTFLRRHNVEDQSRVRRLSAEEVPLVAYFLEAWAINVVGISYRFWCLTFMKIQFRGTSFHLDFL
jgi:hypothetical protein